MDLPKKHLTTADAYSDFVREFVTLLDSQFTIWEEEAQNEASLHSLASQMPAIICLVNTVGYLRGQDGIFLDTRPHTPENQKEFYGYEDLFETRLNKLIDILMSSDEKKFYEGKLESCLVNSRTK